MSKNSHAETIAPTVPEHKPVHVEPLLPKPLWFAYALLITAGLVIVLTRPANIATNAREAMRNCEASTAKIADGLNYDYGRIYIARRNQEIVNLFSLCHRNPQLAHELFTQGLESSDKSERLIAVSMAFYLAASHHLEAEDFTRLTQRLDEKVESSEEIRRAAQRVVSDLIGFASTANKEQYEKLGAGAPPAKEGASHRVSIEPDNRDKALVIRWSSPEATLAWLNTTGKQGTWDKNHAPYGMHVMP